MRSFIQKKSSQQIEEYDLNDIDPETKQLRPPKETGTKNGASRDYCFNPKHHGSRNGSENRRWYSRKQKIDASVTEMETFTPLNNTREEHFHSNACEPCGSKRICNISKKTELIFGRIMLISTIISLVAITNFGSLSIYVPSIIQKHHPRITKPLSRKRVFNGSQENEVISSLQDDVIRLNATNPSTKKITNSTIPKVCIVLFVDLKRTWICHF